MRIGVPKEIKIHEYRVGLVPAGVKELVAAGHAVSIETQAGAAIGFDDDSYRASGAHIVASAAELFAQCELIVKVKEPQPAEYAQLRRGQILFTYLHLAADPAQARGLLAAGVTAIAYETVTAADTSLPLLTPMSEVAGRMAIQVGAHYLQKTNGGSGVLLGGVPGVAPARVLVIGGGTAGTHAIEMALGLGAEVTVLDRSVARLRQLAQQFGSRLHTVYSTRDSIEALVAQANVVVGSVLVAGAAAPKLVTRAMIERMRAGSVLIDIAIDQGGCFETSRPTSHAEPVYTEAGVIHYCVTNMPGAVPGTSTLALTNATLPFVRAIAALGWKEALQRDPHLRQGLNTHAGALTHAAVAAALELPYTDFEALPG